MKKNYIYILQQENSNIIKIGVTNNIKKRLQSIQTGNPNKVSVYHYEERNNAYTVEAFLKKKFISYKKEGEWYENLNPLNVRIELFQYVI
jgi:predicted GIY-YIG superfamily endonuclease